MPVKPESPNREPPVAGKLMLLVGLLVIVMVVSLTGLTWRNPSYVLNDQQPTTMVTITATPGNLPWTARLFPEPADPRSLTDGIIIAGGVIVLIILGGTISATRQKR